MISMRSGGGQRPKLTNFRRLTKTFRRGGTGSTQNDDVVAIMASLLPLLWSTGKGSEVMKRIAVPLVGGMLSSTILTLIVILAVYAIAKFQEVSAQPAKAKSS